MMTKKNKNSRGGGYYGDVFEPAAEYECSGSSGRIDAEVSVSEHSSAPKRKCISLNSNNRHSFGSRMQVLPLSSMSSSEKKDWVNKLKTELERIQAVKRKVEMYSPKGVAVSSSNDVPSHKNLWHGKEKKQNLAAQKGQEWDGGNSGRPELVNETPATATASVMLMKQCGALLKGLLAQQNARVFSEPVDIVKLKIPDYFTIIKHPMDLGTIKKKLDRGSYPSPLEFAADIRLTFNNAMTYNPKGNPVHVWAKGLSTFFETRWKNIEKKLQKADPPTKYGPQEDMETVKPVLPSRKRTIMSMQLGVKSEPAKRVMSAEEKHNLTRDLESLPPEEMPSNIIDLLREHSSNGKDNPEDEIEIDIYVLSDDTLFTLRRLLDEYVQEKEKNHARAEPCSMEILNESGLSNSSMPPCEGNDLADEDIDIGENEFPVSSYPPVVIEKDACHRSGKGVSPSSSDDSDSSSSESECDDDLRATSLVPQPLISEGQLDAKRTVSNPLEGNQSDSGLDQVDQTSQQKPSSVESDSRQDGDSAPTERPVSPEKQYRVALLKSRFADTILRAREKTLIQGDKGDPEKLRRQREELELQQKKEKARIQAEAKAAEDARRKKEAEAAAEAKRKRELEREAARQALLQVEKTAVEINNSGFLGDLEMLSTVPVQLPSSADETSPDYSEDGFDGFKFGGSNPLQQLGLYRKDEDEEEEAEPVPNTLEEDIEEGEID